MAVNIVDETFVTGLQSVMTADPGLQTVAIDFANWGILIVPVLLIALWFRGSPSGRQEAVTATLAATLGLSIAGVLSFLVYAPRPFALGLAPNLLDHVTDSSFPSDHATVMAAVAVALLLGGRSLAGWLALVATLAVGLGRVALGVHFASDIVAGMLLGAGVAFVFRIPPIADFAAFCRSLAEALYVALGIEAAACRLHLQKAKEITR